MTQSQAADGCESSGLTKKQGKTGAPGRTHRTRRELKKELSLRLAGLGILRKRKTKARMGRNPGDRVREIKIGAHPVRFTAAKALKDWFSARRDPRPAFR